MFWFKKFHDLRSSINFAPNAVTYLKSSPRRRELKLFPRNYYSRKIHPSLLHRSPRWAHLNNRFAWNSEECQKRKEEKLLNLFSQSDHSEAARPLRHCRTVPERFPLFVASKHWEIEKHSKRTFIENNNYFIESECIRMRDSAAVLPTRRFIIDRKRTRAAAIWQDMHNNYNWLHICSRRKCALNCTLIPT